MNRLRTLAFTVLAAGLVLAILVAADQVAGRLRPARPAGVDFIAYHRSVRARIAEWAARPKESGEVRVYLFGGSTMVGVPYATLPERWIGRELARANPERTIRVVTAAVGAGGLYRALKLMEDALEAPGARPDGVVVYGGENEFLDRGNRALLAVEHSAFRPLVDAVRSGWLGARFLARRGGFLVRKNPARSPEAARGAALAEFRDTLDRIRAMAEEAGVFLVLCAPASNLADWPPDGDEGRAAFDRARSLAARGRHAEALPLFERARDADAMATRAGSAFLDAARSLKGTPRVEVVDFPALFLIENGGRAPGEEWFVDNCHPTPRGYYLLSRGIARAVQRFIDPGRESAFEPLVPEPDFQAALADAGEILRVGREEAAFLTANLHARNGRPLSALQVLDAALAEVPGSVRLAAKRACVLWSLPERRAEALSALSAVLAAPEGAALVHDHRDDGYYFAGLGEAMTAREQRAW